MNRMLKITTVHITAWAVLFTHSISVNAGIVETEQLIAPHVLDQNRTLLHQVIEREEAKHLLQKYGVSNEQAHARIDSLTRNEIQLLAKNMNSLPVAGDEDSSKDIWRILFLILITIGLVILLNSIVDFGSSKSSDSDVKDYCDRNPKRC